jgi:hypothetical protein
MTANYLKSPTQHEVEARLDQLEPRQSSFGREPLFVIDCRDEAAAFRTALSERQVDAISEWHSAGKLKWVADLGRPARRFALAALETRYAALDEPTRSKLRTAHSDWMAAQQAHGGDASDAAIYIILPISGIRLPYAASDLISFA